ncbi:glycosyltransferase family 2 protein [Winogradskyella ursingii]|uniref:glycosyltransferase family 2 protein n=1 Tax=Winogradskyella ursingii TaxID=2686079 RepID=UPI0015CB77E3|nr:glycosyltransferase [Winogradskyella ursingii]
MIDKKIAIIITTKDRLNELKLTLKKISDLIQNDNVECLICDDGSIDGTSEFIRNNYPNIQLIHNTTSRGLIFSRNRLMAATNATYVISLDDDAHFVSTQILETIEEFFNSHQRCAVISFRLYWGKILPNTIKVNEKPYKTRSFLGGANAFRMEAWKEIPEFPIWFMFHGEEDFASYHLLKNNWQIWYVPKIFAHHRVDMSKRKQQKDYILRLRRSLRSGWYLYLLFYPLYLVPRKILYSIYIQLKTKVFKGDFKAFSAILQALGDVIVNSPRLIKNRKALSREELKSYHSLPPTKIYWQPHE